MRKSQIESTTQNHFYMKASSFKQVSARNKYGFIKQHVDSCSNKGHLNNE